MPEYNYSEVLLLSLETALDKLEKEGGKILLEEIELQMDIDIFIALSMALAWNDFRWLVQHFDISVGLNNSIMMDVMPANVMQALIITFVIVSDHGYYTGCPNDN